MLTGHLTMQRRQGPSEEQKSLSSKIVLGILGGVVAAGVGTVGGIGAWRWFKGRHVNLNGTTSLAPNGAPNEALTISNKASLAREEALVSPKRMFLPSGSGRGGVEPLKEGAEPSKPEVRTKPQPLSRSSSSDSDDDNPFYGYSGTFAVM